MIALALAVALTALPDDNADPCYAVDGHGVAYLPVTCPRAGVYWPLSADQSADYRRGYCAGYNVAATQSVKAAGEFKKLMAAAGPEKPDPRRPGQVIYDQAKELASLGIAMYTLIPPLPCDPKTGRTTTGDDDE